MFKSPSLSVFTQPILILLMVVSLVSCGDSSESTAVEKQADQNTSIANENNPHADISTANKDKSMRNAVVPAVKQGIVKSIQNAGGYSYIEVEANEKVFWMATSIMTLKPGEKIVWNNYAMMKNFVSKSLNKTFPQIMFVDKVLLASAVAVSQQSGRVVKTMDAAGYTYIQVDENGTVVWLAAPVVKLTVGQDISWNAGVAMKNFSSRSLDRTFDEIFFVSAVQIKNI